MKDKIQNMWLKQKKSLVLLAAVVLIGAAVTVQEHSASEETISSGVSRGEVGADASSETFTYRVDGGEEYEVTVDVQAQVLTEDEAGELLAEAEAEWEEVYLGDNESANAVTEDLDLPSSLQDGLVEVDYTFDNYEAIDDNGNLLQDGIDADGTLVQMSAEFSYEDYSLIETKNLLLLPEVLTEEEELQQSVKNALLDAEGSTREEASFKLPETVGGYTLSWSTEENHAGLIFIVLGLCAVFALQLKDREDSRKKQKEREKQLLYEYPQMVQQMALLLGSGMTVCHAWERMVRVSRSAERGKPNKRALYIEEMELTLHEIREGRGEIESYKRFSQRIGLEPYRRLVSILTQNLSKGSRAIREVLDREAAEALQIRKNNAKKLGEEAGSKLLMPMMLFFLLILIIVLWPAVSGLSL